MVKINDALLVVYKSLYLVQEAITGVELALNNAPTHDEALALADLLADLETAKDSLIEMRDQLKNGSITIPSPDPTLMSQLGTLVTAVEQAKLNGISASAGLALFGQVLTLGISVMTLAK
jgi:hypothetical protein